MSRTDNIFKPALEGKNIPILTLDTKWHQLFTRIEKSMQIINLETELNEMLRRQGKLNNELKEIKVLKKKLMDDIMVSADIIYTVIFILIHLHLINRIVVCKKMVC